MDVVEVLRSATDRQGVLSRQELRATGVSDAALSRAVARGRVVRVRRRVYALEPLPPLPRFLATDRVDLCFAAPHLVVEVDGARWHPDPARDQQRDNALAALGWRVLRFAWHDVVHDSARVLATVRAALAAGCSTVHLADRAV